MTAPADFSAVDEQTPPDARLPAETESPFGAFAPTPKQAFLINLAGHVHLRGTLRKRCLNRLHRLRSGPVDVDLCGGKWRLYLKNNECEREFIVKQHRHEKPELRAIFGALDRANAVFVDVGANIGLFSLRVARRHPLARVVSFEPNPDLFRRLQFNIAVNGVSNIHPHCLALGDRDEEGTLFCDGGDAGSWGLSAGHDTERAMVVRVRPLADMLAQEGCGPVAVIKIDVEGYEDRVLLPFLEKTPRHDWPRLLVIEHLFRKRWQRDCLKWCLGEGYRVAVRAGSNTILCRGD